MNDPKKSLRELNPRRLEILILVVVSGILLAAGLNSPVLTIRQLWTKNTFSVMSGIQALADEGHSGLASLLFFFSIVFPIVKLLALVWIWWVRMTDKTRQTALHWLMVLGKWSMLDVFVVAVIVVAVKMGLFADAQPKQGVFYFGVSILLSMIATSLVHHMASKHKQENLKK